MALLLALLLPTLHRVGASAEVTTCASNVRQIVSLMQIYTQGNDGRLPYQALDIYDWSGALTPLGRGASVFRCPADDNPRRTTTGASLIRSYGVNNGPFPAGASAQVPSLRAPWPVDRFALPARLSRVPPRVFLIGDNRGQFADSAAWVGIAEAEALD